MSACVEEMKKEIQVSDKVSTLRVCFVCTGNTCRSPMAAAVANALSQTVGNKNQNIRSIEAFSAGLYANEGEPVSPRAVDALEKANIKPVKGHDYHAHTAHTLTAEEAERMDWIVGLSGGHCMELLMRFPQAATKIVGMPKAIADPYGGDSTVYEMCLAQIVDGVKQLLFSSCDSSNAEVEE